VTKNDIFGLKMMMKSGLEKIILKFLQAFTVVSKENKLYSGSISAQ
jgi:hypothetical protein